jgi:Tat protein translocase TatB subunit
LFLFIFESIGTSELILIGIIALIFLGPRKLPEIARKMGKIMADFRNTTNEFKQTWEREVNFEEEVKALKNIDEMSVPQVASADPYPEGITAPEIKEIDASAFKGSSVENVPGPAIADEAESSSNNESPVVDRSLSEKKDWL